MNILFKGNKLKKLLNKQDLLGRKYGPKMAKVLRRRMDQLRAAQTLNDVPKIGRGRCHELTGDRAGTLSVDLVHPQRLIFEPADNPVPCKKDGGLDWKLVAAIRILEVADTHE